MVFELTRVPECRVGLHFPVEADLPNRRGASNALLRRFSSCFRHRPEVRGPVQLRDRVSWAILEGRYGWKSRVEASFSRCPTQKAWNRGLLRGLDCVLAGSGDLGWQAPTPPGRPLLMPVEGTRVWLTRLPRGSRGRPLSYSTKSRRCCSGASSIEYGRLGDHAAFVAELRKQHGRKSAFWGRVEGGRPGWSNSTRFGSISAQPLAAIRWRDLVPEGGLEPALPCDRILRELGHPGGHVNGWRANSFLA